MGGGRGFAHQVMSRVAVSYCTSYEVLHLAVAVIGNGDQGRVVHRE